jgi:hypothetical protein
MAEGPGDIYICGNCVRLSSDIIENSNKELGDPGGDKGTPHLIRGDQANGRLERVAPGVPERPPPTLDYQQPPKRYPWWVWLLIALAVGVGSGFLWRAI